MPPQFRGDSRSDHGGSKYYAAVEEHRALQQSGEVQGMMDAPRQASKNFAAGVDESTVRALGRWDSETYRLYTRMSRHSYPVLTRAVRVMSGQQR